MNIVAPLTGNLEKLKAAVKAETSEVYFWFKDSGEEIMKILEYKRY